MQLHARQARQVLLFQCIVGNPLGDPYSLGAVRLLHDPLRDLCPARQLELGHPALDVRHWAAKNSFLFYDL